MYFERRVLAHRLDGGATLAELLVGIALFAILAGAAVLQGARLLGFLQLPLDARRLQTDLAIAGATAVLRNTRARVTFARDGYTIRYESGEPVGMHRRLRSHVRVGRVPRGGSLYLHPTGRADNGTIVLTSSGRRRSVVVNQRGRIMVR